MITREQVTRDHRPFKRYGAALTAWRSARREVLLSGPAGTGKSRVCIEKLHHCANKYAGARILIARKTRESITQTAMVTYEQKVLPLGWLENRLVYFNTTDQCYEYPNGSIIAVGGLDKASKIMSSEWDIIYVQEATELFEEDWEALTTRLRNGVMPYQQLISDCNPGPPTHWLKRRADRGDVLMLESRHEDNPSVTPEYLATLDKLTGVRKLRLRYGKWAAAEGMVYEEWNRDIHLVSRKQLQQWRVLTAQETVNREVIKQTLASVDWGFTNPGVIQVYGIDGDDRAYLLREHYKTGKTVDEYWVPLAKELKKEFGISKFVCDPSEPAYIEQFNKAGLTAIKATNAIAPGINAVQARLKVAGDSRPRLYVYEYALTERDEKREAAHEPYCLEQEMDAYAWPVSKNGQPVKEVPVKINDHACLVAGTMVTTDRGDIAIEQIRAGDYVFTRQGYRRVKAAGMTAQSAKVHTLRCSNGAMLTGTDNHPVYVQGKGYIPLRALRYGDIIETPEKYNTRSLLCGEYSQQNQRLLSTRGLHLGAIPILRDWKRETIILLTQIIAGMASSDCIKKSGKMLMALFQRAIIFTTKTAIHSIMRLKIWNAFQHLSISLIMARSPQAQERKSIWRKYGCWLPNGINQKSGESGIKKFHILHGIRQSIKLIFATIVEENFRQELCERIISVFAPIIANRLLVANQALITSYRYVNGVEKNFHIIDTTNRVSVQQVALPIVSMLIENEVEQPVYNLTVDAPVGEYFANGILVHNCDACRYMCQYLAEPNKGGGILIATGPENDNRQFDTGQDIFSQWSNSMEW